ncbi:5-oxoprolinase subunit PxpA [Zunongwangia sp.]|uniref:5-oxoprolinase subunit PxpA n=1 Tax=Zunongwangia sp. TaxID=1965325 RepID=UPI003AA8785F
METININCDLGEGGNYDVELMPLISSCNIACGGHAGNLETMQKTISLALDYKVKIGAHPSYPDKENFGRQSIKIDLEDLKTSLVAQILSLKQLVEAEGGTLSHVKPHGALYNDAAKNSEIAKIIIDAICTIDDSLLLYAPQESVLASEAFGKLSVVIEAFADRNYLDNYQLVPRSEENAVITDKNTVLNHLSSMVLLNSITTINNHKLDCHANTFCLHSDTPNSVEILQYLHKKFAEKNIII